MFQTENIKPFILSAVIVVLVLIGGAATTYYLYAHSKGNATQPSVSKTTEVGEIKNPVTFFYQNFSAKDYHVRVTGKDNTPEFSFYYEKGVLVRIDGEGTYSSDNISIIKNGKLYSINEKEKTFVEMGLDESRATYILELYKVGSILDPILQGESPAATPWTLISQNSVNKDAREYQTTGRKFVSYVPGSKGLVDIRVTLDIQTGLITTASIKSPQDQNWNPVHFQYEEVNDIQSLKNFPRDYKKVSPL